MSLVPREQRQWLFKKCLTCIINSVIIPLNYIRVLLYHKDRKSKTFISSSNARKCRHCPILASPFMWDQWNLSLHNNHSTIFSSFFIWERGNPLSGRKSSPFSLCDRWEKFFYSIAFVPVALALMFRQEKDSN